jgi:hypothetical protein
MPQSKNDNSAGVSIQVSVNLQQSQTSEKPPQSIAYAFTDTGHFVTKAAVDNKGTVTLTVPSVSSARNVRIVVGPELTGEKQPALSDLTRRGAQEQFVRVNPGAAVSPVAFEVPTEIWRCWFRICFVNGTLLKSVISGGLPLDLPVCNAQVQIWEVEPLEIILAKVPVSIIEKLRQVILNPGAATKSGSPAPVASQRLAERSAQVQYAKPVPTLAPAPAADLVNLQVIAQTADTAALRQALIANVSSIRFWICEWIPLFLTKTLVATTTTDQCGNFSALIFQSCFSPNPNLYFTATTNFIFFPIYIYDPAPIACYTYWGYECGTSVTLYTDNWFAPCCSPCAPVNAPQNYVLFRAIGNVPLSQIYGTSTLLTTTPSNLGLAAGAVQAGEDSPFGNLLLPRVEFDSSLLELGLASYYQISYQSPTSGGWQPLTGDIYRHYNQFIGSELVTTAYSLGPQTVGTTTNLFAIPPALPPVGDWVYPNPPYDLANAQFPTTVLPSAVTGGTSGLYQLKLDLYDSSGKPVNIATAGITYYVPTTTEPDGTIDTADASTLPGLVVGNSFIMNVFVDNRPTVALLPGVAVDGAGADPCGMLDFSNLSDQVEIEYVASQPGNFLWWNLDVARGLTGTVASTSGEAESEGTSSTPADFDNTVGTLLGPCRQAAFSVVLNCYSLCTDGWSQQTEYDSSDNLGFALIAPCPPCPRCPPLQTGDETT